MGMAASQSRLLQLTSRKHDIGYQLTMLANDKVSLARETQKISKEYQAALQSKVLKWSNNQGVSYIDLSYSNLMRPSGMNLNKPYLLTDQYGKVVVDDKYREYAERISPKGAANGDWDSIRTEILSDITGISADKIESRTSNAINVEEANRNLENIKSEEPSKSGFRKDSSPKTLLAKIPDSLQLNGSTSSSWQNAYNMQSSVELGNSSTAKQKLESLYNKLADKLSPYFMDNADIFKEAVEDQKKANSGLLGDNYTPDGVLFSGDKNNFKVNIKALVDNLIGAYEHNGGEISSNNGMNGVERCVWYDIDSNAYQDWKEKHTAWKVKYDAAEKNLNQANITNSTLLTAEEEQLIEFYDKIFSSIAEKGWTYNNNVEDTDYLNQILQNNIYTLTTVDTETVYDCKKGSFVSTNEYSTDIATNMTTVVTVSDSDARNDAMVEYENKKSIINAKETRIDTRMKDLETEQSAINQMIQGIEQVRNDNIERNFSIMT